jgi:hypothetical protein
MTNPNWKPQPGKPAMTRDEKTLVTDLVARDDAHPHTLYSKTVEFFWRGSGEVCLGYEDDFDLIEPTAAILAAHGIDVDGKPVVRWQDAGPPKRTPEQIIGRDAYLQLVFEGYQVTPAVQPAKLAEIMELTKRQPYGTPIAIEHDGFNGVVIGWYVRLDGVPGIVAQLDDARVVHVYGEKWLKPAPEVAKREGR